MFQKRGQSWSIEAYVAIAVFLIAIIFFYGLTTVSTFKVNVEIEVEELSQKLNNKDMFLDGELNDAELNILIGLNCTELKEFLHTNLDVCIYIKGTDGNLLNNGTNVIHGIGCPGINISGMMCGSVS
jgi:hypothetical protein